MYIKLLIQLLLGYVRIEVEGYYIERFINICTNRKILVWNLKRKAGVKLFLNIGINDFKKLSEIARKTNCKVRILRKRGVPFLLNRYKKRKIFGILLIIMAILIYTSSKYVWNVTIEIEENKEIPNIEMDLENAGLKRGISKSKIDSNEIINKLRLEREDIAWVGIDIKGTNVIVKIVKADSSPEIIDNSDYCDIIASKAGIITKVIAQNGTAMVKPGDTVQEGDVLIAGYMQGKYTDTRYLHSLGEVFAKVWYSKSKTIKLTEEVLKETGNTEKKYEIQLGSKKIKLYKKESDFKTYDITKDIKNIKLFKNFYLPISITTVINKEQIKEQKNYSLEEAKNKLDEELSNELNNELGEKQYSKTVIANETEDGLEVTVTFETQESIGINRKINPENYINSESQNLP